MTSDRTLNYYEKNSAELCRRYETADVSRVQKLLGRIFAGRNRLLETGSGSCRDAVYMMQKGFDVTAIDGSIKINREALTYHPEMAGKIITHNLTHPLPFKDKIFDGAYSLATLMHFNDENLNIILSEHHRVLKKDSPLVISVPLERDDLDTGGRDEQGRFFNIRNAGFWDDIMTDNGFSVKETLESVDGLGREGVRWLTLVGVRIV